MDIQGGERSRHPDGRFPDRVVAEQAAVVGADPDRSVRIFAQATDDEILGPLHQVGQRLGGELPGGGRQIVHAAVICTHPETPFVVPDDRIDELTGQGGRVAPVVTEMDPFPGQGVQGEQAVVGAHQQVEGSIVGEGVDVVESVSGRDGGNDGPGGGFKPIDAAVPSSQPQVAFLVFVHRADAGRLAFPEDQARGREGLESGIEQEQPLVRRLVRRPDAAAPVDVQHFDRLSVQKLRDVPVRVAEDALPPGRDPHGAVPVLGESGDERLRNLRNALGGGGQVIA